MRWMPYRPTHLRLTLRGAHLRNSRGAAFQRQQILVPQFFSKTS